MQIANGGNPHNSDRVSQSYIDINSCGYHHITDTDYITLRSAGRSDFQLIYLWQGRALFQFPSGPQWVERGQLVLYKPGEPQHYTYFADDKPQSYWIHFTGTGCEELLRICGLWQERVYTVGACVEFTDLIVKIIKEIQIQSPQYNLLCRGYLLQLIAIVGRRLDQQYSSQKTRKYEKLVSVIEAMHNEYQDTRDVDDYAAMCHLSSSRFLHLFKQYTGVSPHLYKTNIRIEKAKDMLSSTTLTVSEISRIVGFSDSLYFSRIFKRVTGMSPSLYRKHFFST